MIYRITVDALERGEEGTESVSFFASTPHDILAAARDLREHLGCTACMAIRFALARCLLAEGFAAPRRSPSLVSHTGTHPCGEAELELKPGPPCPILTC